MSHERKMPGPVAGAGAMIVAARVLCLAVALLLSLPAAAAAGRAVSEVPNVHLADSTRYVSNPDGVLSPAAVAALDARLASLWRQTTAEPVVAVVAKMPDDTDIDTYATELFEAWGIGKADNDNGLLVVVARDDRRAAIRTGYGMEGVVTDAAASRVLRNEMFPRFREGDFDAGTLAAVDALGRLITDPAYAEELRSSQTGAAAEEADLADLLLTFFWLAALVAAGAVVWTFFAVRDTRKLGPVERYEKLDEMKTPLKVLAVFTLGMGALALIMPERAKRRIRRGPHKCANCATPMTKIDEEHDNDYLTPAQDAEERLNSVDYDVWVCPSCNEIDVLPFVNRASALRPCPQCGARALRLYTDRVVQRPTASRKGLGVKSYVCQNCGNRHDDKYTIPATGADLAGAAAAAAILGSGRRGGGFGGGGFGGGSFGGGLTGGGGASGGW